MKTRGTPRLRMVGLASATVVLLLLLVFAWCWRYLHLSLPPLDGTRQLAGLQSPAELARDAQGHVSIRADSAADAWRALGFAHGQDRFFQMDLSRRRGAGELSALFGAVAVDLDRSSRQHGFRELARQVLQREPAERRALLEAYAAGVNAGLRSLGTRPWEYAVLRAEPEPWTPVDCVLVVYAMALDLQETKGAYERTLLTLRDELGEAALRFFNPTTAPDDAALDGTTAPLPPPPGPEVINLRAPDAASTPSASPSLPDPAGKPGSNALVLGGARTASGVALLAGDPHLDLRMPNTWYRADLLWNGAAGPVHLVGATLPGTPGMVIGTNGHLAWTLTNSYADTGDLVPIEVSPAAPEQLYHHQGAWRDFERRGGVIAVKGADPVPAESVWTHLGPLVGRGPDGRPLAFRWTLHDPAATNFSHLELAGAASIEEGLAIAHRTGIPPQNLLLADRSGRGAWTIMGRLPKRRGFDGQLPVSWAYGDRGWDGYLPPDEVPTLVIAPSGTLWSGNQRKLGGDGGARIGDGGFDEPQRAAHLREALAALAAGEAPPAQPEHLLAVQRDDRGLWLERWRALVLATLNDEVVAGRAGRTAFRQLVGDGGALRAEPDSVAYRLMRAWHNRIQDLTLTPIFARCRQVDADFNPGYLRTEAALWHLHASEPPHLLSPDHESWAELRVRAVDEVLQAAEDLGRPLAEMTWGDRNRARIRHPFSDLLPFGLNRWVDLPPDPLPGDKRMPLVQQPAFGASLRFIVSPGREDEGILHLPGGQSGHPLSPFYRAGHRHWVAGEPVPLLPGEAVHVLQLEP